MYVKKIINSFLDILLPNACIGCGKHGYFPLCGQCTNYLEVNNSYTTPQGNLNKVYSAYDYKGLIRDLIRECKYKKRLEPLEILISRLDETLNFQNYDAVIPVPISPERLVERGFNQAEIVARYISNNYNIPLITDLLYRIKDTKPLYSRSKEQREKELNGAFMLDISKKTINYSVLIVDDIMTTGATLNACADLLLTAGYEHIDAFVLAMTPAESSDNHN